MLFELYRRLLREVAGPVEEELRKALEEVVVKWLTDLGEGRELRPGDLEELRRRIREVHKL